MSTNLVRGAAAAHRLDGGSGINHSVDRQARHTEGVAEVLQIAQHADDLGSGPGLLHPAARGEPAGFFDPPGLLFFRAGSVRLLLEQNAASALVYLQVDDLEATVETLRADGVEIVSEPHVIFTHADDRLGPAGTEEHMAFIRDSEGNPVGLVSHRPPGRPVALQFGYARRLLADC